MADPRTKPPIIIRQDIQSAASGAQVIGVLQAAPPPPTNLHQLPPIASNWTGRDAERHLWGERLAPSEIRAAALFGMAGVGKTALAVKLAAELRSQYPDAQFFLDMQGTSPAPRHARDALAHVIRGFGWSSGEPPRDEAGLIGLYRSLLAGKKVLVLLDNVREAEQVEPLLPPDGCLLLLTSRWHFYIDGLQELSLEELSDAEAQALLIKIAPRAKDDSAAIAKVCGNLPQALTLAGKWVRNNRTLAPSTYLEKCRDAARRLKLTGADVALQVSYDALDERQRAIWRLLAVFPASFDAGAAAPVWGLTEPASSARAIKRAQETALEWLNDLVNTSLLEWAESTRRYRLHDLARAFADSLLSDAERGDAALRHAAHFVLVLKEIDEQFLRGGPDIALAIARFDREETNIRAGQAWVEARAATDANAARICLVYANSGTEVPRRRLPPREWLHWLQSALAAARQLGEKALVGETLGNLAVAYLERGDLEQGTTYTEQALALIRENPTSRALGAALANMGAAFLMQEDPTKAIKFLLQAIDIYRRNGNPRGEGRALTNLVVAQLATNDLASALKSYEQAQSVLDRIGDLESLSALAGNFGIAAMNLNRFDLADSLLGQQLVLAQKANHRHGEASARWNLAMLNHRRGNLENAQMEMQRALTMLEQLEDQSAIVDARRKLHEWTESATPNDTLPP